MLHLLTSHWLKSDNWPNLVLRDGEIASPDEEGPVKLPVKGHGYREK